MSPKDKKEEQEKVNQLNENKQTTPDNDHLGSADAFEETENPLSPDEDNISDEKLDELLGS